LRSLGVSSRLVKAILLAPFFFALVACSRAPTAGGVIDDFGTFPSPDARLTLKVSKQSKSIVAFDLLLTPDGRSVFSDSIGSDAQRWCFYWDAQSQLWAYSSDTGYFASIAVQPDGTATKSDVVTSGSRPQCPKPVYDFLPSSMKRRWEGTQSQ
jgi:hypothetical protein